MNACMDQHLPPTSLCAGLKIYLFNILFIFYVNLFALRNKLQILTTMFKADLIV